MTALSKRPAAIRAVLPFVFRHWLKQPGVPSSWPAACWVRPSPTFHAGVLRHLVDALTRGPSDPAARHAALMALGGIVALGAASMMCG